MSADVSRAIEGLYACGHALFTQQRWSDAAGVFRAMVVSAPSDERGWLALGMCHEAAGHIAIALEMWSVAMQAGPAVRCAIARAKVLRELGRDDEADVVLEAAQAVLAERDDEELETLLGQARSES